jgi:hypothetical protein
MTALISTLADLVAPLSGEEFVGLLRARTPQVLRGAGVGRYDTLIGWDELFRLVTTGTYPAAKLRLTRHGRTLPPFLYRDGDTPRADVIEQTMASGGSVVAYGVDPYVPNLARLCANIAAQMGERIEGALVATTGPGGAIDQHYDKGDVVALQIEGSKRWLLASDPVVHPVAGMRVTPGPADAESALDVILEAGDLLFIPAGYRHRCENQAGRSLHASIFFWPLTPPRVLDLLFRQMVEQESDRKPLRFGADAEVEAELKRLLVERVQALSLEELRERHRVTGHDPAVDWRN